MSPDSGQPATPAETGMTVPARPALRWFGGKWKIAQWIITHFPPHKVYVEPFGGAASVLLRKPRSYLEIYNDLDGEVVNFFRVLRDRESAHELQELLRLTPYARAEFILSYSKTDDPVERARRLVIRSSMGWGSKPHIIGKTGNPQSGFRTHVLAVRAWKTYYNELGPIIDRLTGVIIEQKDAFDVMAYHDSKDTLHYVDPPYLAENRGATRYNHELVSVQEHTRLLEYLKTLSGMVVLSGYPSALYDDLLRGWKRVQRLTYAEHTSPRTEVLWINPAATAATGFDWLP